MIGRSLQKCYVFICLFFICPKNKFRTLASFSNGYGSSGIAKHFDNKDFSTARRSMRVMRDNQNLPSGLADSEPGFNLTDDEIVKFKIWPQGIIPYYIDDFSFDKVLRDRIRNYLDLTNRITGLRFVELPSPPADEKTRWVLFVNRQGLLNCADHSTKDYTNEGVQKVILGYDCLITGGELAESILALVGVPPQHNSPDRNNYIKVVTNNIIPEKRQLFNELKNNEWLFHDITYDFLSASHYSLHKYTNNGFATINILRPLNIFTGEGKGFSYKDIWKIRMLYNYIARKKVNSFKASDCMKLFEPGANFTKYVPLLEDIMQPRNKPNKYLGLPDNIASKEADNKTDYENNIESNLNNTNDDDYKNDAGELEVNTEEEEKKKENKTSRFTELNKQSNEENISSTKLQNRDVEKPHKKKRKQQNRIMQLKNTIHLSTDPFRDISDFGSWETTKHLKRIFTKVKG